MEPASPIRVASVPAGHPYVVNLRLSTAGVAVLEDPVVPGAPSGRWWPPVMLSADWIGHHAADFDVMHVHFGVESFSIGALSAALDALDRAGRPLVFTVHDLEHPQLDDQSVHRAQLDRLVTHAAALITLTHGAAAEIKRRWGRSATVIAHPHMTDTRRQPLPPPVTGPLRIGVHLRDLRPNIAGPGVVSALAQALAELGRAGIEAAGHVVMFDHVRDRQGAATVADIVADCAQLKLTRRPPLSDDELVADLARCDLSLLPYRHGTHSGWAELCWDLGLPMVGAAVGYIAEQHAGPDVFAPCDPQDAAALTEVLGRRAAPELTHELRRGRPATVARRRRYRAAQAPALAQAHRAVYRVALGQPAATPGGRLVGPGTPAR